MNYGSQTSYLNNGKADNGIVPRSIVTDGVNVFSIGWGTGFAHHTIDNNGDLTLVFSELKPDGSNAYLTSIAICPSLKKVYVGRYSYARFVEYDYSTGAAVNNGTKTTSNTNLPKTQAGYAYTNGLAFAGEWLYIAAYGSYTGVYRWNPNTDTGETLTVSGRYATMNHGRAQYDSDLDRMYIVGYSGSGIWVIDNASTASPTAWQLPMDDVGLSRSTYFGGVHKVIGNDAIVLSNKVAAKIHIERGNTYRTGTLSQSAYNEPYPGLAGLSGMFFDGDLAVIAPDRGWNRMFGFYDSDNEVICTSPKRMKTPKYQNSPFYFDYGGEPATATSPDGTEWNIITGYGGGGNMFRVFSSDKKLEFNGGSWEATFGPYTIDSSDKSGVIVIDGLYTMSTATFSLYYSVDGTSWTTISPGTQFTIPAGSTTIYIKMSATQTNASTAYIMSQHYPLLITQGDYTDIETISQSRLGGALL